MKKILGIVAALGMLLASNAQAGDFADEKIVLQISDPNPFKQTLVLNVAGNVLKHYGQDKVDIEIVAFGPGLGVLVANKKNKNLNRITSLAGDGVTFSACGNTMKKLTKKNKGKTPKLHAKANVVPAGVIQILELQEKGYSLIKP